jgi:NAD(P)-dependent dehydrogenase (short-subunit alcohol dehydrogenase family)
MTEKRLSGKVAIVTGGASGIGLATTQRFAREGARVMVADVDGERLASVKQDLGSSVEVHTCDVRIESDVRAMAEATVEAFGGLDIVFANAGVGSLSPIVEADATEWMRVVEVNLLGPVLTIKHAVPRMSNGGSIILTASLNAVQPAAGMSAYCCSKAALAMLANVAAMEVGPMGIRVNAVGPGLVQTNLTEGMWLMPSVVEEFIENAPLKTHPTAEEIANLVTFLASDEARTISGSLYLIDGGAHTNRYPDVMAHLERLARP